jgi:hypothetical protein
MFRICCTLCSIQKILIISKPYPCLQALEEEAEAAAHIQPSKAKKGKKSAPSFADLEHAEDSDKEEAVPEEEIKALVQRTKGKKSKGKSSGAAFAALSLEGDEVEGGEEPEEGDTTVNQVESPTFQYRLSG